MVIQEGWGDSFNIHYPLIHNTITFAYLHFSEENFLKVLNSVRGYDYFSQALIDVMNNKNLQKLRSYYRDTFRYDDKWYFNKFKEYFKTMNLNYRSLFKSKFAEVAENVVEELFSEDKKEFLDTDPKIIDFKKATILSNEEIRELIADKLKNPV